MGKRYVFMMYLAGADSGLYIENRVSLCYCFLL